MPSALLKSVPCTCPHCQSEIPDFEMDGVALSFCSGCKGLWLDKSDLAAYLGGEQGLPNLPSSLKLAQPTRLSCARCPSQTLVEIPFKVGASLRVDWCPQCQGVWLDAGELEVARRLHTSALSRPTLVSPVPTVSAASAPPLVETDWWQIPVMLIVSQLLSWVFPGPLASLLTRQFHELGHALADWATSTSRPFYFSCLILSAALARLGQKERRPFVISLAVGWALIQTYCCFVLSSTAQEELVLLAGAAGEIVVPALLMVFFFYRLPAFIRWDYWRFPVFVSAATAFLTSADHWRKVAAGQSPLPVGSLLQGKGDTAGDIHRLVDMGWNTLQFTDLLNVLTQVCLTVIAVHYAWFLAQTWLEER